MRVSSFFTALVVFSSPLASGVLLRKEHSSVSLRTGRMRQAAAEVHNMNAFASEVMTVVRKAGHELEAAFEDKPAAKAEHVAKAEHAAKAKTASKKTLAEPQSISDAVYLAEHKIAEDRDREPQSISDAVYLTENKIAITDRNHKEEPQSISDAVYLAEHKIANTNRNHKDAHKIPDAVKTTLKEQQDVLTKLFAKLKTNIGDVNKGEKDNKAENEKYLKEDEAKLARDKAQLEDPKITAHEREILVNRTRMDQEQVTYWKKGRELQHGMFHANLKIAHGLMSRVKSVLEAYGSAFAKGGLDKEAKERLNKALGGMPHALIETRAELRRNRREYRSHSRSGHRRFEGFRLHH